jgi:hypothetical protein
MPRARIPSPICVALLMACLLCARCGTPVPAADAAAESAWEENAEVESTVPFSCPGEWRWESTTDAGAPRGFLVSGSAGGGLALTARLDDGSFDLVDLRWDTRLIRVHVAAEVLEGDASRLATSLGRPLTCSAADEADGLAVTCSGDTDAGLAFKWRFLVPCGSQGRLLYLRTRFSNTTGDPVTLRRAFPFRTASADGGALVLGQDPSRALVLQNGSDERVDYYVALQPAALPLTDWRKNALVLGRSSYSTGNALVYDPASGAPFLVGFTALDWAIPLLAVAGDPQAGPGEDGRVPLALLQGEARFPKPTDLPPGDSLGGGEAVFVLARDTPFDTLEAYADAIAARHAIHLPPLPLSGWDSWYTPRVTDIDEGYIWTNSFALQSLFGDWGLASQQCDMGWQDNWGDWNAAEAFPSGMAALAASIRFWGLTPELWVAPFSADEASQAWQAHPDWFVAKDMYGKVLMDPTQHAFDLGRPDVLEHLGGIARRIRDWGFGSVKMDFAYYALLSDRPADHARTPVRLYRDAVKAFRAELGPEVHFTNIAMAFPNYGLVDGFRMGLDTWPCWEGGAGCEHAAAGLGAQGVKPMVRMAARRYWLNGRVWWNHQDQVFVRDLAQGQVRAWFTLAAMAGGMVSLGEDVTAMPPAEADYYRRILPLSSLTARPLDLFEREFPEVWVMRQDDPPGVVVALFHWGSNRDLTHIPFADRPGDQPVTHRLELEHLGLGGAESPYVAYDFWSGEVLGGQGAIQLEVPPHSVRVLRLARGVEGAPYPMGFLATDRHVLMGPGVVDQVSWQQSTQELYARVRTVPGLTQRLLFQANPDPSALFAEPTVSGVPDATWRWLQDGVLEVTLTGRDGEWHGVHVPQGTK